MDDLRKTFKDLFSGGAGKKFAGQGRKLGSADGASGSGGGAPAGPSPRAPPPPPPRARPPPPPPDEQTLKPAAEFSPFTAVVGGGAARNVIQEAPATPPPPALLPPPPRPATPQEREAIAAALAVVRTCPRAAAEQSLPLFAKILRNAVVGATALHRQLRLGNPRVRKAVVDVEGGLALLTAAGFVVVPSAGGEEEGGDEGALAVLTPDDDALARAHEALGQVERGLEVPAPTPAAAIAATPPPAPKPRPPPPPQQQQPPPPPPPLVPRRCASLILPVAPDSQPLPEAFFQRTAHEVRDEYRALVARRQRGELLLTRAAREAAAARGGGGGGGPSAAAASTTALVRIRLPDGCSLEGRFGANEPYEAVREFVRAALREPRMAFELKGPTGADNKQKQKPAANNKTVRDAGLCPSAVLNFRPLLGGGGGAPVALASSGVLLRDEVLSGGSWA